MVRQEWSLIGLGAAALGGAAVFAPIAPYLLLKLLNSGFGYNLGIATAVSAVISIVISVIFYRINIGLAGDLLKKAET